MEKNLIILTTLGILVLMGFGSGLLIESVSSGKGISPGEVTNVRIGIENNGNEDIEDVSLTLELNDSPFAPFDSSSEFNLDDIDEGKTRYAEFEIKALNDAKPGIYKIPLIITYIETEIEKTKASVISIEVYSEPVLGVSLEESVAVRGRENEISIKIINKGLGEVRFLETLLADSSYYTVLSPNSVYIGDISSDDFDSVDLRIYVKEEAPDSLFLPVNIRYIDSANKEYSENVNLKLEVYDEKEAQKLGIISTNNTFIYAIIIIVLVIVYIGYRRVKKRRAKRTEYEKTS